MKEIRDLTIVSFPSLGASKWIYCIFSAVVSVILWIYAIAEGPRYRLSKPGQTKTVVVVVERTAGDADPESPLTSLAPALVR